MSVRVLDLFSGCGGLSLGLCRAGMEIVAAVERDEWAAQTYAINHPGVKLYAQDISSLSSEYLRSTYRRKIDIVAGGPPCQGFSVSGKRQYGIFKPENQLVYEFIRVVEAVQPDCFVLENVRGFTSATIEGRTRALHSILRSLEDLGYNVFHSVLQATEFGVPQQRSRLFVIGSRLPIVTPFPRPTHAAVASDSHSPFVSVHDAIADLPVVHAGEGSDGFQPYTVVAHSEFAGRMRSGSKGVTNHQGMRHGRKVVERFKSLSAGEKGYDLGRSVAAGEQVTVYKSNNQRLNGAQPSLCITAHWQSSYVHPWLDRNLTVREAARLQTFPDKYVFRGKRAVLSKSLMRAEGRLGELFLSQSQQVGNAVPPLLAEHIGRALLSAIENPQQSEEQGWSWTA